MDLPQMKTLDQIGVEHLTDKSSLNHHYLSLYDLLFRHLRDKPIRLLEIGVQFGNSLRTWRDYFTEAMITGLDSVDNGVAKTDGRVRIRICDAYSEQAVLEMIGNTFDIIIDDGSHEPRHQKFVLDNYLPLLSGNGILIIEDVLSKLSIDFLVSGLLATFDYTVIEMTRGHSMVDSRLLIVWPTTSPEESLGRC